jgi:ABC-type sugar transport system ATPase subunit
VHGASFAVRAGEILGLAGLPGSGAEETLDLLYGRSAPDSGEIRVAGRACRFGSPRDAVAAGLALVPKDRLAEAALGGFSVRENVSLPSLGRLLTDPLTRFVRRGAERDLVSSVVGRLNVKSTGIDARMDSLSGGNQQKAILARWLGTGARVYLLNSPTAAVDVGAKAEIYRLLARLADEGAAVLFTSTEVEEFPRLCDRVLVFRGGGIAGELTGSDITEARILGLAVGLAEGGRAA